MNIRTTLAIFGMVSISIGGLAQKTHRSSMGEANARIRAKAEILSEKGHPVRHLYVSEDQQTRTHHLKADPVEQSSPLKADPAGFNVKEKLDSMVSYSWDVELQKLMLRRIEYYKYNALGRNYSTWDIEWMGPDVGLVPHSKYNLAWNSSGMISREVRSHWIDTSKTWLPDDKTEFWYDDMGNRTVRLDSDWDGATKKWFPDFLDSLYFTNDGKRWKNYEYRYDTITKQWNPDYHWIVTFDMDGNREKERIYYWRQDTAEYWGISSEVLYFQDENGWDTLEITRFWDGFMWMDDYRQRTIRDAKGNVVLEEDWYWDMGYETWAGNWRVEYEYDLDDRLIERREFNYEFWEGIWYLSYKGEFQWDANGNRIEELESRYDTTTKAWTPYDREEWTYDLNIDIKSIGMPYWWHAEMLRDEIGFNNKILSYADYGYDTSTSDYKINDIDSLFYSGLHSQTVNVLACRADFSWQADAKDEQILVFSDQSDTTVSSWYWMFGDGITSTRQNPKHLYEKPGTYRVVLTTVNSDGFCSNTIIKQVKVGNLPCNAAFTHLMDTMKQELTLINASEGNELQYYWNFGDGSVSKEKDPVHTYKYAGSYQVTLTVSNLANNCMDKYTAQVQAGKIECVADFVNYIDSVSNTVLFRAKKINKNNRYRWIFGDGGVAHTPNHVHKFSKPGYYSAMLTVSNDEAGCIDRKKTTILVGRKSPGAIADFIFLAGDGNQVKFTDKSLGDELKYYWNFNDSETSTEKNPVHTYAVPGYYNVCLTVSGPDGSQNMKCMKVFAGRDDKDQCLARFNYKLRDAGRKIYLIDRSLGNPDSWYWRSSKGHVSRDQNPDWTIGQPDYVLLRQTITNSENGCTNHAFALVNMGAESMFRAAFGFIKKASNLKADTYPVDFVGTSLGDGGKLKWDFGDGSVDSTTINPTHYYTSPGVYNVCLTVTNTTTGEVNTYCDLVYIYGTFLKEMSTAESGLRSWPNPFSENNNIEILLTHDSEIDLAVYDLLGRKVKSIAREFRETGNHRFILSGEGLESGNYYLVLKTGSRIRRTLISVIK